MARRASPGHCNSYGAADALSSFSLPFPRADKLQSSAARRRTMPNRDVDDQHPHRQLVERGSGDHAPPRTSSGWRGAVSILIMPTLCPFTRTLLRGSPPRSKAGTCPWTYHGACGQAGAAGSRVTAAGRSLTLRRSNTNSKRPTGIRCGYTSAARVSWRPSVDAGLVQPDMPPRTYPFKVELSETD